MSSQNTKILTSENIEKQILYWNASTFNNIVAYTDLINRQIKKELPCKNDLDIRDFYFTNKLTIDGKFQTQSFIQKSIPYLTNFNSIDKNSYLQSVNYDNNIKKYRFWNNILDSHSTSKEIQKSKSIVSQTVFSYQMPVYILFSSFMAAYIYVTGIIKLNKSKQISLMVAALITANIFIKRRRSSDIFYDIEDLPSQKLEEQRKNIIDQSIIIDGKIYNLYINKLESQSLLRQASIQPKQSIKKILLQTAGFDVITQPTFII